ncbi:chitinase [Pedobacter mucosus]|uniref:chitinase n=1 Tax=Pedobacter mucosus TaxID=2895286 RepID=UPI001EE3E6FA|nr:chitinase [Pedobacter mucosus]UKT64575.1 chitinase [Pedobacter mucosus]
MRILYPSIKCIAIMAMIYFSFGFDSITDKNFSQSIISEKDFNAAFPLRNQFYSYNALKKAINNMAFISVKIEKRGDWIYKITRTDKQTKKSILIRQDPDWNETWAKAKPYQVIDINYGDFCSSRNNKTNKIELAAWFAHIAHETRNGINGKYNDGLMLIKEAQTDSAYATKNAIYSAVQGREYYGRGPLQLSYNGNYGFASDCIFGDKNTLLNNPDLLSADPVISFESAIYFWMTPQSLKPSAHDVITGKWIASANDLQKKHNSGFGLTINIINGKVECNKGENNKAMQDRVGFYQYFLKKFNLNGINCTCSCAQMMPFAE